MKLDEIKAVFLDADDTIFTVRGSVGKRYAPYLQEYGIQAQPHEIDRVIPIAWKALTESYENKENRHVTDHDRDKRIWEEYVNHVLGHFSDSRVPDELFEKIYLEFGKGESRELSPHIEQFVSHLRSKGLTIGVLTNNDKRIHTLIPELGMADHFDHVFCASDLGFKKPSAHVFHAVREILTFDQSEILYIGDCLTNDVQGAQEAGWEALWYNPKKKAPPELVTSIHCFQSAIQLF